MAAGTNAQRVFVKVAGFTDVERHALNTVFRLSEQRDTVYWLWEEGAPEPPRLALVDELSESASLELASLPQQDVKLIWVGSAPPADAWRSFERPLSWPEMLAAMDELFAPAPELELDLDLDFDTSGDTLPPPPEEPHKRALIASGDRDERLYLRARLALAELTHADEAETGAQALELARSRQYDVALLDFALPDVDGWALLKQLRQASPIPHVIITKDNAWAGERLRAWWSGVSGCFGKPPDPGKLQLLLQRV